MSDGRASRPRARSSMSWTAAYPLGPKPNSVLFMQMGLPGVEAAIVDRLLRWAKERGIGQLVTFS